MKDGIIIDLIIHIIIDLITGDLGTDHIMGDLVAIYRCSQMNQSDLF